jgi:hypothetical protein
VDIYEISNDYEQLATTILAPKLSEITIKWHKPYVLIKPLSSESSSFILQMDEMNFEINNTLEKNRITEDKRKKQYKQLESIWCENKIIKASGIEVNIKLQRITPISNKFNLSGRMQTPLFIHEYEQLFPNEMLDKNKEIRIRFFIHDGDHQDQLPKEGEENR